MTTDRLSDTARNGTHVSFLALYIKEENPLNVRLSENPSIYRRGDQAVVIFPSRPYWFSATEEVGQIIEAFKLGDDGQIVSTIAEELRIAHDEAQAIFEELSNLLYASAVLSIDGNLAERIEYNSDFQLSDVENVLVIAATQGCNMRCPMCYAQADRVLDNEMSTEEIVAILDQLSMMPWQNGISRVALTGGELFTRPDAIDLIAHVNNLGFHAQVNTNATLLTHDQIRRLAEFPRVRVSVSVDGSTPETHDLIRGKGAFDITTRTIRQMCEAGVAVTVNMLVHRGNCDQISDALALTDTLGISGFNCLNMMHIGRGKTTRAQRMLEEIPLAEFFRKIFEAIRDDSRFQELMTGSNFSNQIMGIAGGVKCHTCGIGTNRAIYTTADGSVYPCANAALPDFKIGNLRTDNLANIWDGSPTLQDLRSLNIDTMNAQCAQCDVRYICAGDCRGESYQTTGDLRSPHFRCNELHDSVLELMWILTEAPDLFKHKVDNLYATVSTHASTA